MNYPLIGKGIALALFLSVCATELKAQKIDETQLKVDVNAIDNSTEQIKALKPVSYRYEETKQKTMNLPAGKQNGFLASSVSSEYPNLVTQKAKFVPMGKNQFKVVKYNEVQTESVVPVLVAAMKEQQTEINNLKKELNQLKSKSK